MFCAGFLVNIGFRIAGWRDIQLFDGTSFFFSVILRFGVGMLRDEREAEHCQHARHFGDRTALVIYWRYSNP